MALEDSIPCFLRFGCFQVRVKYENQRKTCRKCNSPDHLAKECTSVAVLIAMVPVTFLVSARGIRDVVLVVSEMRV